VLVRVSLGRALSWIDATADCLDAEQIPLEAAAGRVTDKDMRVARAIPPADCAAIDGYAVCAEDSFGAGAYNPIGVAAITIESGEALPPGTDAVVPLDHGEFDEAGRIVLVDPVAGGTHIDRAGSFAAAGTVLVAAGASLTPHHVGMLILAGFARVTAIRRPRVRLVIVGNARFGEPVDADGPMLRALIKRDGGTVAEASLGDAFAAGVDIILIAGGTGHGQRDRSAAALSASGRLEIDGVALIPGETSGFGHTASGVPVILLPGAPIACLWGYEFFGGRAIKRFAGRDAALPYPGRPAIITRKIVSAIGSTEIYPVRRLPDGRIQPIAPFVELGLTAAIEADGFVIVPEASEGYPADTSVTTYFYKER
jgi:molybdopterin molybdotransferase